MIEYNSNENEIKSLENLTLNSEEKCKSYEMFENKDIARWSCGERKKRLKELVRKAMLFTETNDLNAFNMVKLQLTALKLKKDDMTELNALICCCDKMIKNNYKEFGLLNNIFRLLSDCLKVSKCKKIKLDWKIYFKIFFILKGPSNYEFASVKQKNQEISSFFNKCLKYFNISTEDYISLKNEALRLIYTGLESQIDLGLQIIYYFLPKDRLSEDEELQSILIQMMKNKVSSANSIFGNLAKFIKKGLKVDVTEFIHNFFNILNNYISKSICIGTGIKPSKKNKKIKPNIRRKEHNNKDTAVILSAFLFSDYYKEHRRIIDNHFQVLLNLINNNLKENSKKDVISFNLKFIEKLIGSFTQVAFKKEKRKIHSVEEDQEEKDLSLIPEMKDRIFDVMAMLHPILIKSIFYDETPAVRVLLQSQRVINTFAFDDKTFKALCYLFDTCENNYSYFIEKITAFTKIFLNYENFNKKEISEFFFKVINLSIEKSSAISVDVISKILQFFSNLQLITLELKKDTKINKLPNYVKLFSTVEESSLKIVKKILSCNIFDIFNASKRCEELQLFLYSVHNYVSNEVKTKIADEFFNYSTENIMVKENAMFYFKNLHNFNQNEKLWKFCFDSLVYKSSNITEENTFTIDNELAKNYQVDVLNDKKSKYLKVILNHIDYSQIDMTNLLKDQMLIMISTLLNQKDARYHKIAYIILNKLIASKLNPTLNKGVIRFPNLSDLELIYGLFEIILNPTVSYIKKTINLVTSTVNTFDKKDKLNKRKWLKENYPDLEKKILLFLRLENSFTVNSENPFLRNNTYSFVDELESKQYKILREVRNELNIMHCDLYKFLVKCEYINTAVITKHYLRNILNQNLNDCLLINSKDTVKTFKKFSKHTKILKTKEKIFLNDFRALNNYRFHLMHGLITPTKGEFITKDIELISKLYINSTDKKIVKRFSLFLLTSLIFQNISKKAMKLLELKIYKVYVKKLSKIQIENGAILTTDKKSISLMLAIYSTVFSACAIIDGMHSVHLIQRGYEFLIKVADKNFSESLIITRYLMSLIEIKNKLPISHYLIDKKLKTFPFLNELELKHLTIENEKIEKYKKKNEGKIAKVSQKLNAKRKKLATEIKTFLKLFLEATSSRAISNNINLNYMTIGLLVMILVQTIDVSISEDYIILSNYEKYFLTDLVSDSTFIQKKLASVALGAILKIKNKYINDFEVIKLSQEDFDRFQRDIITEDKSRSKGLYYTKGEYLLKKYNSNSPLLEQLEIQNINNLLRATYLENFKKLMEAFIILKDVANDRSLIEGGLGIFSSFLSSDGFNVLNMMLSKIQNPHHKLKTSFASFSDSSLSQNLFDESQCKFFYNTFNIYNLHEVFDYDSIFNIFYNIIGNTKKDLVVNLSVLLHLLCGMIKNDINSKKYQLVKKNIYRVMEFFTNNTNKKIDHDILTYFSYLMNKMAIKDFMQIFSDDSNYKQNFSFMQFDSDFVLKFVNAITKSFSLKSSFIFEEDAQDKLILDELVDSYLTNNVKLVKNINTLKFSLVSIFHLNRFIIYNFKNFDFKFDDARATEYVKKFVSISKKTEIKEMKQLCGHLVFMYKKFFIFHPDLLNDLLLEISKVTYLDIQDFNTHLSLIKSNFQFPCLDIHIEKYLNYVENNLNSLDNLHSRKFFIDLISMLFKSNLNNYNTPQNYQESLSCILRMINLSQFEIKEYITNNLLVSFIHSLDNDTNEGVIRKLKESLEKNFVIQTNLMKGSVNEDVVMKNTHDDVYSNLTPLSIIFVLGAYLKSFDLEVPQVIQDLIVSLKQYNSRLFKNKGAESKLIKNQISDFFNKYKYTYEYTRMTLSISCQEAIDELSKNKSYFI